MFYSSGTIVCIFKSALENISLPGTHYIYADLFDADKAAEVSVDLIKDGSSLLTASFTSRSSAACLDLLMVNSDAQNQGISKKFMAGLKEFFNTYQILKCEVNASFDAGAYVFAKYGFKPYQEEWDRLRERLQRKIATLDFEIGSIARAAMSGSNPDNIWTLADTKAGKHLLLRQDWKGSLDLEDAAARLRFESYLTAPLNAEAEKPASEQAYAF